MKKSFTFVLLLCIVMVFGSSVAMGAPLTKVDINAFTAQNYQYQWQPTPTYYPKSMYNYSFSGPELYMDVVYTGDFSNSLTFITVNGTQYTHSQLFYRQYYITSNGVISGYEVM